MSRPTPSLTRKSSAPWDRLKPVKQDPLESMGYVSKGDDRLLDAKAQEAFYHKIVHRYMTFCSTHAKDLEAAFASLSLVDSPSASSDPTRNPPIRPLRQEQIAASTPLSQSRYASPAITSYAHIGPAPEDELSTILTALRKLREGLLASSKAAPSPIFSQRVHIFNIRMAILALHPPSYHPSLLHLLNVLHTDANPLPMSELVEMTTYLILDLALRQNDLIEAYAVKHRSQQRFGYVSRDVDAVLRSITTNNWVAFWRVRRRVDGHIRALMHWYVETLRKTVLKAFGRAYLKTDIRWLMKSTTSNEMSWETLVEKEKVGWLRDGDTIIIRKPKPQGVK